MKSKRTEFTVELVAQIFEITCHKCRKSTILELPAEMDDHDLQLEFAATMKQHVTAEHAAPTVLHNPRTVQ